MNLAMRFLIGLAALIAGGWISGWFIWRSLKRSEDPGSLALRWGATFVSFPLMFWACAGVERAGLGWGAAFIIPAIAAAFGVFLGILWAPYLGALIASPFASFYDGGSQQTEARPFYAIARAKQKRGKYDEALAAIRVQLERFPEDFEGWMLLAEIYARDLKDNAAAQECVAEILRHGSHSAKNIAFALTCAAEWHLNLASDREAAREAFQEIARLYPETELAHVAAQRIAHLTSDEVLNERKEPSKLVLTRHDEYIGLRGEVADPRPREEDPAQTAARLVDHLQSHPADAEAREQLAGIYATHYQRIELASEQLESLIALPGASARDVARWLNQLADFHVTITQDRSAAAAALGRIIELFPKSAAAEKAETRIAWLETEMRKNKKSQALQLGSYEESIGLKGQVPRGPG